MIKNYEDHPHITATSIVESNGSFLLVEEDADGEIVLNQPSGHVEPNETPLKATIRETLEESGCHIKPVALLGIYFYHAAKINVTYQRICFISELVSENKQADLDVGIIAVHWLSYDEIVQQKNKLRSPLVLRCIDDYIAGQHYDLNLITSLLS